MKLGEDAVKALSLATRIALDSGKLKTDEHARVLDLFYRACDALENWTYDRQTGEWSITQAKR